MSQANNDRSREAINNLNNKVDQKRLAQENRLLRWLTIFFIVALGLTIVFNHHPVEMNETDVQHLRDYSGHIGVERSSEPLARPIADNSYRRTVGPTWTF
jgi:hypothetical protein